MHAQFLQGIALLHSLLMLSVGLTRCSLHCIWHAALTAALASLIEYALLVMGIMLCCRCHCFVGHAHAWFRDFNMLHCLDCVNLGMLHLLLLLCHLIHNAMFERFRALNADFILYTLMLYLCIFIWYAYDAYCCCSAETI